MLITVILQTNYKEEVTNIPLYVWLLHYIAFAPNKGTIGNLKLSMYKKGMEGTGKVLSKF